jgi:endonuclease/exonuclease/phosphatase family metal-dependent hydrolase
MKTSEEKQLNSASAGHQHIVDSLKHFQTFQEMRRSNQYAGHESALKQLFNQPRIYSSPKATPRLQSFLRALVWNIERGTQIEGIIETLNHHAVLRYADVLLLNELDDGMIRSGNRNVALELSRALSAHAIYGVEYLEFTKGTGAELNLQGENTTALHGNAILTRHKFSNPQLVRLPRCENNFESAERRIGGRLGILVDIEIGGAKLLATTAHLDVVNTPHCRGKQLRAALEAIEARLQSATMPDQQMPAKIILGGDFNTHTFARGGQIRTLKNTVRILGSNAVRLKHSLMKKERAIKELERFAYEVDALNDGLPTSSSLVSGLDDKSSLPAPLRWWVMRRVGPEGIRLEFRLDWLAARGLRVLHENEITDVQTGVKSIRPHTVKNLTSDGKALSDHEPIVADFALP